MWGILISSQLAAAALPAPSELPGLLPSSDMLKVTSVSVTSVTVIQIRIYQWSWETFPGLTCGEACDSRSQCCPTSETNKHAHVQVVALPRQTQRTDDIIQIMFLSGYFREMWMGRVLGRLSQCFSSFYGGCPLWMQGKEAGVLKGRSWTKWELPGEVVKKKKNKMRPNFTSATFSLANVCLFHNWFIFIWKTVWWFPF